MRVIRDQEFGGERPLYASHDLRLENVTIHIGESSIKESSNIEAENCRFEGRSGELPFRGQVCFLGNGWMQNKQLLLC